MNQNWSKIFVIAVALSLGTFPTLAQQTNEKVISVDDLFKLVEENHPTLKSYRTDVEIAEQNVTVAKNQMLPEIAAGAQAYHLGDVHILDKNLSDATRVDMPHFGNQFSLDAHQLIWKGNTVKNSIKVQSLRQELSELNYETNEQSIKLLVLSYYLELHKLNNQENVYKQNIALAEKRLANINKFYNQAMVTRNDVIRGELQISNLNLALQVVNNNQQILNQQLVVALGLDENIKIIPMAGPRDSLSSIGNINTYESLVGNHPTVLMAERAVDIYDYSTKIARAEMMPSLSAFAGNSLQRPLTTASPVVDMYSHGWSAGLSLNFSIDALFKAPKKVRLMKLERQKALYQANEVSEMIDVAVKAAHIKYNEALSQNTTLKVNTDLTAENYRIMESKYNNQLAILLDLIDASNAKLDAELQFANSEINIIYAHYKLLKEAGSL